jgi:hypothetical protein
MCLYKYKFCDLIVILCTYNILHPDISVTNTDVIIFDNRMEKLLYKG